MSAMHIVTIDGPAGAGKSTIAKNVAQAVEYDYLDTGAIYRAATLVCLNANVDLRADPPLEDEVYNAVDNCSLELRKAIDGKLTVLVDGEDVTESIRTKRVTDHIRYVADLGRVRELITSYTRKLAASGRYVCEGRDQGTVVFPDAFLKIYLWATPAERAKRRAQDLKAIGESVESLENLERDIRRRDMLDMSREIGGLKKAIDAVELDTTELTIDQVTDKIAAIVKEREAAL